MEIRFLGPDKDELIVGELLIPSRWILQVMNQPGHGLCELLPSPEGDYIVCFTDPADVVMAATHLMRGPIPQECFFCGGTADIESSLKTDQNCCESCFFQEQLEAD